MTTHYRKLTLALLMLIACGFLAGCTHLGPNRANSSNATPAGMFGNKKVPEVCGKPESTARASLADKQNRGDIHLQLGMGYLQQGQYDTALSQLEKALKFSPSSAQIHSALALLNIRMNRPEEAEKSYQRALRIAPGDPEINNNYGYFLCQQGEYLAADKRFQCALANPLYDTPWRAYYNGGICALKAGELKQADIYLRTTRQLQPDLPQPLYYLADLAYQRGGYLQAADYLKRYRDTAEPNPESLWLGIKIARKLNNKDMEASDSLSLKNLFPDSDQAQSLYAQ